MKAKKNVVKTFENSRREKKTEKFLFLSLSLSEKNQRFCRTKGKSEVMVILSVYRDSFRFERAQGNVDPVDYLPSGAVANRLFKCNAYMYIYIYIANKYFKKKQYSHTYKGNNVEARKKNQWNQNDRVVVGILREKGKAKYKDLKEGKNESRGKGGSKPKTPVN